LTGLAGICPAPLEHSERKYMLLETLQETRDPNAGRFCTRKLMALTVIAPNHKAQPMLHRGSAGA